MGRTPRKKAVKQSGQPLGGGELKWRITRISLWRKAAGLTQQAVADRLGEMSPPIELDRVSIQRIETGNQRPMMVAIEAMAALFNTDVTSLLDRTPEEAREISALAELDAKDRRRLLRLLNASKDETP